MPGKYLLIFFTNDELGAFTSTPFNESFRISERQDVLSLQGRSRRKRGSGAPRETSVEDV